MPVSFTSASEPSPRYIPGAVRTVALAGFLSSPSYAGDSAVRELDVYCVAAEGARFGVAASQDGATNSYVWPRGSDIEITRSVHSRRTVSLWHAELDLAGFDRLASRDIPPPYCAIDREEQGQLHVVRWPKAQTPPSIAAVFAAMLADNPAEGDPVR